MVLASQIDFCQAENNDDAINLRCFEKNVLKKNWSSWLNWAAALEMAVTQKLLEIPIWNFSVSFLKV